ncbi:ROK family protein [Pediococcus siamensis]|uniref:ROK family protein n=1 Tax=Pediococcus siamensis TaxID=381829 RepID=UPI0039A2A8B2
MTKKVVSIDIGGTSVKLAIIDDYRNIIEKWQIPTNIVNNGINIISDTINTIKEHLVLYSKEEIVGIGIGIPGPISVDGSRVIKAVNLGWNDVPLKSIFEDKFDVPVNLLNDANSAALGEMWAGAGQGINNLMFVTLGTGVGAGIIIDGKIINGAHSSGGEIGHIPVISNEHRVCGCGNLNCLESFASANGMVKTMKRILTEANVNRGHFTTIDIFRWMSDGDKYARQAVEETTNYLGFAFAGILNTLDLEKIVIGGGLSGAGDALLNPLIKSVDSHVFSQIRSNYVISLSQLGNNAGIFGDAAFFFNEKV